MSIFDLLSPSGCSRKRGGKTPESTHQLVFPGGWQTGPIFDKYDDIFPCKDIARLQLRRDTSNVVHHRFIVLYMKDGALHRFDRRPGVGPVHVTTGAPVVSLDECVANLDKESERLIESQSLCEIELSLDDGTNNVLTVVSTCYAIAQDEKARYYSLFGYNCFFFSWTILMVVSRQRLPQFYPPRDPIMQNYASAAPEVISQIAEHYVDLGKYMLVHLALVRRDIIQRTVPPKQRGGWWNALVPPLAVKALLNGVVGLGSHLALSRIIRDAIEESFQRVLLEIWETGQSQVDLDDALWLNGLEEIVSPFVNEQIVKRIWDINKERLDAACTNTETIRMIEELLQRQKPRLYSRRIWAVRTALIKLTYSTILSLRDTFANQPRPDDLDAVAVMFDTLWRTGSAAVQSTMAELSDNPPAGTRDREKWKQSWDLSSRVILQVADTAQPAIRSRVCEAAHGVIKMATQFSVKVVTQSLKEDKTNVLSARLLKFETRYKSRYSEVNMTNRDIQDYVQNMMKASTKDSGAYNAVHSTMSGIWAIVKNLPQNRLTEEPREMVTSTST
ncbi:hypothetical protein FRC08_009220 [Ceratobasidium sp. 394]|nr:hypothetical protein FRC08_009220 [Ceratobasidium sp. 394]